MNTTLSTPAALTCFSDLSASLFGVVNRPSTNASAYIAVSRSGLPTQAANVRPFIPDPPSLRSTSAIVAA